MAALSGRSSDVPAWAPRAALAAGIALCLLCCCANWRQTFLPDGVIALTDGDCYARMSRVAEICAHPGTIIRSQTFENFPFGVQSHATAPFDFLIAALALPLGRDLAGAWISPLLGLATVVFLWLWGRWRGIGGEWFMLLALAASPILAHGFELGRPDHQSLQLLCIAAALAAEWKLWQAPSRGWGLISGAAWALGLWTSLYEPLILLALTLAAVGCFHRQAFRERERLAGLLMGMAIAGAAYAIERPRPGLPDSPYFAAWSQSIGELRSTPPWSSILFAWTSRALPVAPFLLWRRGAVGRGQILLLAAAFALTCWQVRWGYFLALLYAMSLPDQLAAIPAAWRGWGALVLAIGLWPMAEEWAGRIQPSAERVAQLNEQRDETLQLHDAANFIRRESAGRNDAGILAPWWLSPALAYWSGEPAVAGSSHESLPGTVDTARFYLSDSPGEIDAILRARRVRWVIAYEPERVFQTAAPLLQRMPSARSMGSVLYDHPEEGPAGFRLAMASPYFKVYQVSLSDQP